MKTIYNYLSCKKVSRLIVILSIVVQETPCVFYIYVHSRDASTLYRRLPLYLTLGAYEGESASFLFLPFLTWLPTGRRDRWCSLRVPPGSPENPRQASASRECFTDSPGTCCAETRAVVCVLHRPQSTGNMIFLERRVCCRLPRAESGPLHASACRNFPIYPHGIVISIISGKIY